MHKKRNTRCILAESMAFSSPEFSVLFCVHLFSKQNFRRNLGRCLISIVMVKTFGLGPKPGVFVAPQNVNSWYQRFCFFWEKYWSPLRAYLLIFPTFFDASYNSYWYMASCLQNCNWEEFEAMHRVGYCYLTDKSRSQVVVFKTCIL